MSKKNKLHKIDNPHDKLFKAIIQDPKNAKDLLKATCPTAVKDVIDFNSFKLDNDSYLTEKLKEWFSDVVFKCKTIEGDLKLTLLFEHKSYKTDPYPQLLRYIAEIIL